MSRGGNINRPFLIAPRREYRLREFYFAFGRAESNAVLTGVQRQKAFSGISTPPATKKRAHAPKNTHKIDLRPAQNHHTPHHTPHPQSIPPQRYIPPPPRQSPPPTHSQHPFSETAPTSLPLNKKGVDRPKEGYKTLQNSPK